MLACVCAVLVLLMRAVLVSCLPDGSRARGGGPVSGCMSRVGVSLLLEQEFEEVGQVRRGQCGCILQAFVAAVC